MLVPVPVPVPVGGRIRAHDARKIALHAVHGHAAVLLREAVSARLRTQAGRHVDVAALHRRTPRGTTTAGRPRAVRRHRFLRGPADVLLRFAEQDGFADDVHVGLQLVVPVQDVQVVRAEAESPRLVEVPRSQREYDRDQDAEPEESGPEQVIIVAKDGSRKPPGGDERIKGLETRQLGRLQRKVEEKGRGTHGVYPDENNTNKHGDEHPNGPDFRQESVKQICGGSCGDDHHC